MTLEEIISVAKDALKEENAELMEKVAKVTHNAAAILPTA